MTNETVTKEEYVKALTESAQVMFVTLNGVFELHSPEDSGDIARCSHCSALAKESIIYPCPTASILLADMVIEDAIAEMMQEESTSETSEPVESEELSS